MMLQSKTSQKQLKQHQIFYRIVAKENTVEFESIFGKYMYENASGGFIRKAISKKERPVWHEELHTDGQFSMPQTQKYWYVRLYDLYQKQLPVFPEDESTSSFIEEQPSYNSFLAESGIISYDYLRTLFITQKINREGYYEYFVKRQGQYHYETCDDYVPVEKGTRKPIWNLSLDHPWQLLLMKAWLKECGSFEGVEKAEPFRLLEAFGLPAYRCFNFRKELNFLKGEQIEKEKKKEKINNYAINKSNVIIIAKTIDDPRVRKVGLVPNYAAYRTLRITKPEKEDLYRVYSSLPCYWVGSYSPIFKNKLNDIYKKQMFLNLQRNFLATQKELTTYFNKFYVVPFEMSEPELLLTQDCINIPRWYEHEQRIKWLSFEVKSNEGMLAISIEFPKIRDYSGNYPQFRYFLSRNRSEQQISRSHFRPDVRDAQREGNMYIESNCDKWQYYSIDYVQGYHNSANFFCRVVPGLYMLHIDTEYNGQINVRFDSFVPMTKPEIYRPSHEEVKEIFDSTFFSISADLGVEASLKSDKFEESISLNNSFEELGYGSIAIKTLSKARHRIAMRIFPDKLKKAGLRLLDHYEGFQEKGEKNLVLISSRGRPEIVVMQKIDRKQQNTIGVVFPPPGTVQFFKLTPEITYN